MRSRVPALVAPPAALGLDRDGRIAYTGHPGLLGEVLEPILAGTWNLDSARTAYAHRADALGLAMDFMTAYRADRFDEARARYSALAAHDLEMAGEYAAVSGT